MAVQAAFHCGARGFGKEVLAVSRGKKENPSVPARFGWIS
jgi:hypothetical protein